MAIYRFISCLIVFVMSAVLFGCSSGIKPQSIIDTPENHYISGLRKLASNDNAGAESEFLRTIVLDRKSPAGHTGLALLELNRSDYRLALKYAEKALKKDSSFIDAHLAKGQIITEWKKDDAWRENALKSFMTALELAPGNEKALYFMAEYFFESGDYARAIEYYSKTKEINGEYAEKSSSKILHAEKIIEVSPLTDEGKRIAEIEKISRSDLCVLLIKEFKLKDKLQRYRPEMFNKLFNDDFTLKERNRGIKSEIGNNIAKEWILEIIQMEIPFLDLYPDGYFYPDRLVTKSQFAVVVQEVLAMITGDQTLTTRYIGMESRLDDVRADFYAFNAVNLCLDLGILRVLDERTFGSDHLISGIDAVLMLRKLEKYPPN